MSFKNVLLTRGLAAIQPLFPPLSTSLPPQRILVVTTTALGDTLWATPAIESLRKSFATAFIAVLTSAIGTQVLRYNPHIDQIYQLREPLLPQFCSLRSALAAQRFDTILLFHASQRL